MKVKAFLKDINDFVDEVQYIHVDSTGKVCRIIASNNDPEIHLCEFEVPEEVELYWYSDNGDKLNWKDENQTKIFREFPGCSPQ